MRKPGAGDTLGPKISWICWYWRQLALMIGRRWPAPRIACHADASRKAMPPVAITQYQFQPTNFVPSYRELYRSHRGILISKCRSCEWAIINGTIKIICLHDRCQAAAPIYAMACRLSRLQKYIYSAEMRIFVWYWCAHGLRASAWCLRQAPMALHSNHTLFRATPLPAGEAFKGLLMHYAS